MDGLQGFACLCANLPLWTERLDALTKQVNQRHAEFTRLSRTSSASTGSIRRKQTVSTESLRPNDAEDISAAFSPTSSPAAPPPRIYVSPGSRHLFHDYRVQAKKKRLPGSPSAGESATESFRSRMSLIVYYDSAIQENFDWLVRVIAGARNTVRKGRSAASLKARVLGMKMEESPFQGDGKDISKRNSKMSGTGGQFHSSIYSPEPFDQVEKELEAAQSLCEVGAYQFLRDGGCTNELFGTRERFMAALHISKEQKALYEEEERERQRPEMRRDPSTDGTLTPESVEIENSKDCNVQADSSLVAVDPKLDAAFQPNNFGMGMGEYIEIDENEDSRSANVIDLFAFRQARRAQ